MTEISISCSETYTVYVGGDLLKNAGKFLKRSLAPCRLFLLTDTNVAPLWLSPFLQSAKEAGYTVIPYTLPAGEKEKNPQTLFSLWNALAENGFTRTDAVIALGGGVICDLAGFAAATFLRGIPCFLFPTTLLAMADAAVGGKTAVDLPAGKNAVGTFTQPAGVFCDVTTLSTLPPQIYAAGMAEVLKYGFICDFELLESLRKGKPEDEYLVTRAVEDKKRFVEADEKDTGIRHLLNYGHTGAHAVELLSGYEISHGEAVAIGMVLAAKSAVKMGICQEEVAKETELLLKKAGLPTSCPYTADALAKAALADKKRLGNTLSLILPRSFSNCFVYNIKTEELAAFFSMGGAL